MAGMVAVIGFFTRVPERHLDVLELDVVAELFHGGGDAGVLERLVGWGFLLLRIEDQRARVDGLTAFAAGARGEEVGETREWHKGY